MGGGDDSTTGAGGIGVAAGGDAGRAACWASTCTRSCKRATSSRRALMMSESETALQIV